MNAHNLAKQALDQGQGILRLAPAWVPRAFCIPGRRLRLDPRDLYAFGAVRGGIDERWFASTTPADNGPLTTPDEGLSYLVMQDGGETHKTLLRDAVESLQGALIGERLWSNYGRWPMFAKFFDNQGALPHHLHQRKQHAEAVGERPKPEAYYFPRQVNNHGGDFPFTFFGLKPGTTRDDLIACLRRWDQGDNGILGLSQAYKLELGMGWDVPAGVLHAPGSLCTYEPQGDSDVFSMFQSLVNDVPTPWENLVKNVPEAHKQDLDYIVDMVDLPANLDPDFARNRAMAPRPIGDAAETAQEGYIDQWIAYRCADFAAKETTILPGATVTLVDQGCYGLIVLQGHGQMGPWQAESPALIRFGQLTNDEFFVSEDAARAGVVVTNPSDSDSLVMLRHYGPGNPDLCI